MSAYVAAVSIRRLFAMLVALAVLVAPAFTSAGMAVAAPADQMLMMDQTGHCQMPLGGTTDRHKSDGKSCCISMCMALAVAPMVPRDSLPQRRQVPQFAPAKAYHGLPAEIATPPPRNS